jgi:hypothetical protein
VIEVIDTPDASQHRLLKYIESDPKQQQISQWMRALERADPGGLNRKLVALYEQGYGSVAAHSDRGFFDQEHKRHIQMFLAMFPAPRKTTGRKLESWITEQGLSRTSFFDYKAGHIKGKVSATARRKIEQAIANSYALKFPPTSART